MEIVGIERRLLEAAAAAIHVDPICISPNLSFDAMGFDSLSKVGIVPTLEEMFSCRLQSDVLFDYPTVELLAQHVAELLASPPDAKIT